MKRQHNLQLVLENIHDPHNVSAIFRTADAVGIPLISLIYNLEKFPRIGKKSSASAYKWVEKEKFSNVEECFNKLHSRGMKIFASYLDDSAKGLYELDLTQPCAIVLGNEHRGISEEVVKNCDETFFIPMFGMVQSLNVSVAAAVILYEAARQRLLKGMYDYSSLSAPEFETFFKAYLNK